MHIKVTIGQNVYTIPEHITVAQFALVQAFGGDVKGTIQACLGATRMDVNEMDEDELAITYALCERSMMGLELVEPVETNFETWSFARWIDADALAQDAMLNIQPLTSLLLDTETGHMPLKDVWSYFQQYMQWRSNVYKDYKNLFGTDKQPDEEAQQQDIVRLWWDAVMVLSDGKFKDIDNVIEKPVRQAMNYLAWKKEQNEKLERDMEQTTRKMKAL